MEELFEEYPKLPKNIRQIGEREEAAKIYVEDYVNTYLRRLYPEPGKLLRVGILLGNLEVHEGVPFIFVDGALEMEEASVDGERILLSDEVWKKAYDDMGRCFPKSEILGWFLCAGPGVSLNPISYWNQHGEYFPGKYKLLYLNHTTDVDESLYMTSIEGFYRLGGYCIYYERNQCMQDYMVMRRDVRRIENGVDDSAARNYKLILQEKKGEVNRKKSMHMMYGVSSFLLVLVIAGGVTMMNNYDKMKNMEVAIANLSENVVGIPANPKAEDPIKEAEPTKGIVVEHIQGGVSMTEAQTEGTAPPGTEAAVTGAGQENNAAGSTAASPEQGSPSSGGQLPGGQPPDSQTSAGQPFGGQKPDSQTSAGQPFGGHEQDSQPSGSQPSGSLNAGSQDLTPSQETTEAESKASDEGRAESKPAKEQASETKPESEKAKDETVSIETREVKSSAADEEAAAAAGRFHIVEAGETLYSICLKQYHSVSKVEEICELNQIEDPDKITIGQKLILP